MPPPLAAFVFFFFFFFFSALCLICSVHSHVCSPHHHSLCPPFTSPPSFPFSFSPACGHPSFQLKCSSNHSLISINNLTFSILRYEPNSTSLLLSPHLTNSTLTPSNCSSPHFLWIPTRSINLSSSPFRFSDGSCNRLSVLEPCSPPNLPNCSHCPWECKLIKSPVKLLHGCGSSRSSVPNQGCQGDVLGYLDNYLQLGIELEWDQAQDSYFSNCRDCKANNNGICGFNSSHPMHPFLCLRTESQLSPPWMNNHIPNRVAILCSIFAVTCFMVIVSISLAIIRSRRLHSAANEEDPTTLFLQRHRSASLLPPVFTYEELESSTNKFDTKRKIGDGGFGSVYLAQLHDGRVVAVKHLHKPHHSKAFSNKCFRRLIYFGLSRLLVFPETGSGYVWTGPQGTPGYLDPDYHKSFRLTDKSDVYSFGVVVLELVSGQKAVDQRRDKRELALADMMVSKIQMGLLHEVVDPVLVLDGSVTDGVDAAAELAFRCVAAEKDDRPDAREVVAELKRIRSRTRGVSRASSSNVVGDERVI